jgi:hypothetical protein
VEIWQLSRIAGLKRRGKAVGSRSFEVQAIDYHLPDTVSCPKEPFQLRTALGCSFRRHILRNPNSSDRAIPEFELTCKQHVDFSVLDAMGSRFVLRWLAGCGRCLLNGRPKRSAAKYPAAQSLIIITIAVCFNQWHELYGVESRESRGSKAPPRPLTSYTRTGIAYNAYR